MLVRRVPEIPLLVGCVGGWWVVLVAHGHVLGMQGDAKREAVHSIGRVVSSTAEQP